MKLRIPLLAEIFGLFLAPTTVAQAIAGLERAQAHLEGVHHQSRAKAQRRRAKADALRDRVLEQREVAALHEIEAERALRVAERLAGLTA